MLHLQTRRGITGLSPVQAILFVPGGLIRGCPLREGGALLITISIKRDQSTLPLLIRMGFPIYCRETSLFSSQGIASAILIPVFQKGSRVIGKKKSAQRNSPNLSPHQLMQASKA